MAAICFQADCGKIIKFDIIIIITVIIIGTNSKNKSIWPWDISYGYFFSHDQQLYRSVCQLVGWLVGPQKFATLAATFSALGG